MIEYDKINYTDLKKVVLSANGSGVLPSSIRHVAVKGPKLYDAFITAIENLPDEDKPKLPDDVIEFFNRVIMDDEEPEEEPELNFEEDPVTEPEEEPEEIQGDLLEEPTDPIDDSPIEPEPPKVKEKEHPKVKEKAVNLDKKPTKKMQRLSKTKMSVKIDGGVLTIEFKELGTSKEIKLPPVGNIEKLKPIRKEAMDFGKENNASNGQLCAISKEFNIHGYYMR